MVCLLRDNVAWIAGTEKTYTDMAKMRVIDKRSHFPYYKVRESNKRVFETMMLYALEHSPSFYTLRVILIRSTERIERQYLSPEKPVHHTGNC